MAKIFEIERHNNVRTMSGTTKNIVEIGMGTAYPADGSKDTKAATVKSTATTGIAIGHDCYVDAPNGIAIGAFQKAYGTHSIAEGQYFCKPARYGEKRRSFYNDDDEHSRSWFEWYGQVTTQTEPPGPIFTSIFLHGQAGQIVTLEDYSAMTFNIKVAGTDKNDPPNVSGYHISGTIKRGNGAATTAIVGTPIVDAWEDVVIGARVRADTVLGGLDLQINTSASGTFYWTAAGWLVEQRW